MVFEIELVSWTSIAAVAVPAHAAVVVVDDGFGNVVSTADDDDMDEVDHGLEMLTKRLKQVVIGDADVVTPSLLAQLDVEKLYRIKERLWAVSHLLLPIRNEFG